jgi:hypothetical protein
VEIIPDTFLLCCLPLLLNLQPLHKFIYLYLNKTTNMKKIFAIAILGLAFNVKAQTIESSSHSTTGYVKSDGTIENSSHSTKGYIKNDGTIENSSHSTIGYIKSDGTIENSSHSTVGYVKSDGTVENSSHSTIGYVKSDGTVENSSHSTIGHANGTKKEWAAVVFFFFKFN